MTKTEVRHGHGYPYRLRRELLDEGHGGLIVAASDLGDRVEHVIRRARKVTRRQLNADEGAVAKDIEAATGPGPDRSYQHAVAESEAAVREAEAEAAAAERAAEQYSSFGPRPAGGDNVASQLGDLAKLRESGMLSAAEFESAKSKLIGG